MKFFMKRNENDQDMLELWTSFNDRLFLSAIIHNDCLDNDELPEDFDINKGSMVELTFCPSMEAPYPFSELQK